MAKKFNYPVVAILGATATGKSELAIELAKATGGAIINCDSRQVYSQMDIGTAKPSQKDFAEVDHFLYNIIMPDQYFSAADYMVRSQQTIKKLWNRNILPILVGGTGFYYSTLHYGLGKVGHNKEIAKSLNIEYNQYGIQAMLDKLNELDPEALSQIDIKNPRKVIRAIEIVMISKKPFRENIPQKPLPEANFLPLVVTKPRNEIHNLIAKRVEKMIERGLESEVKNLIDIYGCLAPGLRSIGYQEWFEFFEGKKTLQKVKEEIIVHTRQYAKRQEIWFKKKPGGAFYNLDNSDEKKQLTDTFFSFISKS